MARIPKYVLRYYHFTPIITRIFPRMDDENSPQDDTGRGWSTVAKNQAKQINASVPRDQPVVTISHHRKLRSVGR